MSRRFAAPRRGEDSPPGPELLGVVTSHGPFRESYKPCRKARGQAAATGRPLAADAALSAEGVRAALSSPASAAAVLQRALPSGGAEVVAVEGAAAIPGDEGRPGETEWPKPALPGAGQKPETTRVGGSWRPCEGNHSRRFFSSLAVTGPVATRDSCAGGEVPGNASVRARAGARWSGSGSGSGAGNGRVS